MSILDMSLDPSTCKTFQIRKTKSQELDECISSRFVSFPSPDAESADVEVLVQKHPRTNVDEHVGQ